MRNFEVDSSVLAEINDESDGGHIITGTGQKIEGYVPNSGKRPCLGDDFNGFQPTSSSTAQKWLKLCDKTPDKPVMPSAKTTAATKLIIDWQEAAPNDKIIVFVEWAITANVLGRMLQSKKIPFVYYFGELDPKHRAKTLKAFEENESIKVMVSVILGAIIWLRLTSYHVDHGHKMWQPRIEHHLRQSSYMSLALVQLWQRGASQRKNPPARTEERNLFRPHRSGE